MVRSRGVLKSVILCLLLLVCKQAYAGAESPWKERSQAALEKNRHRLSSGSLNHYAKWVYSQYGEDGIIEEIFKRLKIKKGFFVEFGASDGIFVSNTRHLWEQGWKGVYIEPGEKKFQQLKRNYKNESDIQTLDYFVSWKKGGKGLFFDDIKAKHFPDEDIDFLSIDVDGADYFILKSLKCRPKVICIENNLYWHPMYEEEVPEHIAIKNLQQPLPVLIKAAKEMGYEPVCLTINLFLIRKDLYEPFKMIKNDPLTLWTDAFRVFHSKQKVLNIRKQHGYYLKLEGRKLNREHPITVNF